jgi:hypothetical protein|tara:strand:+ start:1982 stop:2191 length:210 start_codon:yes stop_codon:yes gene_type:complete
VRNRIIKKGFRIVPTILVTSLSLTGALVGIYLHEAIDNPASIIIPFVLPVIGLIIAILLIMKLAKIINY